MKWDPGFGWTYDDYARGVETYQEGNYKVSGFEELLKDPSPKHLVIRHDVDFSIEAACSMAKVDHSLGVSSTFFVRVCANGYSLTNTKGLKALNMIQDLGHEVGLHLDPGMHSIWRCSEEQALDRQFEIICAVLGDRPLGMSTHEPARLGGTEGSNFLVARWGLSYHAYEDRFVNPPFKYLSDSQQRWREKPFIDYVNEFEQIQVLLHPLWWFDQAPQEHY